LANEKERKNTSMTQYYSLPFGKSSIIIYTFSSTVHVLQAVIREYIVYDPKNTTQSDCCRRSK